MGLKNSNGNYLKIKSIDDSNLNRKAEIITWEIWVDQNTRISPTDFDKPQNGTSFTQTLDDNLNTLSDPNETIKNNRIIAGYKTLKELDMFSDWEDC